MIEKKLVEALEPLVDQLVAVEKKIASIELTPGPKGLDGEPGKDADPEAVASIVIEKYADALRGDVGAPGAPGRDGEDGRPGADSDPVAVAEILVEKHGDLLRGRDGIGIKSVKVDPDRKSLTFTFDDDQEAEIELPEGPQGEDGKDGLTGVDGIGFDAKAWNPGVYREKSWVVCKLGKVYRAKADTAAEPGKSDDWERVGPWGFEWTGVKKDRDYEDGDLYIDGGTTFLWFNGKGHMFAQRGAAGAKGEPGKDGKDAPHFVGGAFTLKGAALVMSDGSVLEAPIDGIEKAIENAAGRHAQDVWEAAAQQIIDEGGTPIRSFRGQIIYGSSYSVGDVVNFNKSLWIATEANKGDPSRQDQWRRMISAGGGGGGGGGGAGGIVTTTSILANGVLNMGGFSIGSLGNPRNGAVGDADAVNKLFMQQAIAAGTLFQGVYRPAGNAPDLGAKGNTGFAAPAANTSLFAPPGAPLKPTDPLRVAVWFQVPDVTFPLTLAAPKHVVITLSNGQAVEFNVPAATYADQNALIAAYLAAAKAANPLILNMIVHKEAGTVPGTGALWMAVETLPAVYATSMSGQIGGGFPVLPPGAANTILNSYSWNIQTTDPNLPEYLPAGLPGIAAGTKVNNSDLLQYNAGLQRFEIIRGGNLTQGFADNRYWQLTHGNMAWQDQAYDKGAVVYGVRFNAWFVATQNIVPGTPEPGTTAAAAVWRKINSTYGSTIFFGRGDYDQTHTDAAHNWGMPAGTYPSGQQPLNGDSYFDVLAGTEVQFGVTQNAPLFVINGVTTINSTNQVGTLTHAQMDGFLPAANPLVGQYYFYDAGTAHTATGGSFNGVAFAAGHKYYIVWSGDKDADHNGWVVVDGGTTAPAAGTTKNWSINTPHPQAVPDTITPTIVWGYRRNFVWAPTGVNAATEAAPVPRLFLSGIPPNGAIYRITITDRAANGAVYELMLTVVSGIETKLDLVSMRENAEHFITGFGTYWNSTNGCVEVGAFAKDDAINGRTFDIVVQSVDGNMGALLGKTGGDTAAIGSHAPLKQFGAVVKVAAILSVDLHTYDSDVEFWVTNSRFSIPTYVPNGHGFRVTFGVGLIKYHAGSNSVTYGVTVGTNPAQTAVTKTETVPGGAAWRYSETFSGISGAGMLDQIVVVFKHTASGGGNGDTRVTCLVLVEDLGAAASLNQIDAKSGILQLQNTKSAAGVFTVTQNNMEKEKTTGNYTLRVVFKVGTGADVTIDQLASIGTASNATMGALCNNFHVNQPTVFDAVNTASATVWGTATDSFTLTPKAGVNITKFETSVVYT